MKIAIVLHSQTGVTLQFANSLKARLASAGHDVSFTQLQTAIPIKGGSVRQKMDIAITNLPDVSGADLILLGGPVWAFGPSPVICEAIKLMNGLKGKRILCFVTMGFPFKAWGGKAALRWMDRIAAEKGARVLPGSICRRGKLEADIKQETERVAALLLA